MATPETKAPETGTNRVIANGAVRIPGPTLPTWATQSQPKTAAKAKVEAPAPFVVVSSHHLVKTLAKSSEQNRLSRLKELARTNRDVAWLLAEFQSAATPEQSESANGDKPKGPKSKKTKPE